MAKPKYIDVNKEKYLEALFLDLEKSAKMISFDDRAKLIHDFIVEHPSSDVQTHPFVENGRLVLHAEL